MAESLPREGPVVDPFAAEPEPTLYPPVDPKALRVLTSPGRRPYCNCPCAVRLDGWIMVWHRPDCGVVLGESLEAIL